MSRVAGFLLFSTIPAVILLHLLVAPYTKVEESFHIQAIHDILRYGFPIPGRQDDYELALEKFREHYDHFSFPGAVPRTFVGALLLSGLSKPVIWLDGTVNKQILARAILGFFNTYAILSYASRIRRAFGENTSRWYLLFQASQFHVIYYASRTLSNMFAFGFTTLALGSLIPDPATGNDRQRARLGLVLLTISGIVFRSEIAVLLLTQTIFSLATGHLALLEDVIPSGITGLIIGLTSTVVIDSFFWQQFPLWPEWSAFTFNILAGQASAWGTEPWYYYFTNALPRLLFNPLTYLIGIPASLYQPGTRKQSLSLLIPPLAYVGLYSIIPHKEWRFVIYVIPPLTASAALGTSYIWNRRSRSVTYRVLSNFILPASILVTFLVSTLILLPASSANYPGAQALKALHVFAHGTQPVVNVHMGNLACQTGITRFQQLPPPFLNLPGRPEWKLPFLREGQTVWTYDKTEDPIKKADPAFWNQFDYVLAEIGSDTEVLATTVSDPHLWVPAVEDVTGFAGLRVVKPGQVATGKVERRFVEMVLGDKLGANVWEGLRNYLRRYLTKGWWLEVRMEPKIRVLRHLRTI